MGQRIKPFLVIVATLGVIAFNWLANALPLAGRETGEVSDKYLNLFTPAGYAFAIWGLIYAGLLAFSVYQALPSQADNPRFKRIRTPYIVSCAANCLWLYCWHNEAIAASVGVMLVLLLSLILIHGGLEIGRTKAPLAETWLARVPLSIYLGWITVATIINVTVGLMYLGFDGAGVPASAWALVLLAAALGIAATVFLNFRNAAYVLTVAWGLAAIAVKQQTVNAPVALAAAAAAVIAALIPLLLARRGTDREQLPQARTAR